MSKTVLVLGGSYVGLTVSHKLLKNTQPALKNFKVVLVNPSTHMYWNCAAVRGIIPNQFKDEQLLSEIAPGFKQYPAGTFDLIIGTASKLDPASKSVTIKTATGDVEQKYDTLIIATGSRTVDESVPWKAPLDGYESTKSKLHEVQQKVQAAKSIVVVGGGPTGIETAAELGFEYGKTKEIRLISSAPELYGPDFPAHVTKFTNNELKKLNVKVTTGTKVTDHQPTSDGKTELTLSDGSKVTTDLYLPTIGVIPNTEFVPKALLDDSNKVKVDQYLRVEGHSDIWCAGDAANAQPAQLAYALQSAPALAKNVDLVFKGKQPSVYKTNGAPVLAVTLGRSRGTGRYGNTKLPSFIVWLAKGRNFMTPNLLKLTAGNV